ncbi:tetratricopeptide repeat protein [Lacinutrix algicola]|uniref:tetratricopeptide repeat protein n=1 Tax=Lacinutrix algicola TaxID=342954 RepID=UPI0006E166BE|nr:tetratricopeptide repeat protein [Lacinutrix algicola]
MKNKIIGILITLGLLSSCKNRVENENKSESDNNVRIEFTDEQGNKISKEDLENSTGTFNYEIYGIEGVSDLAKSLHSQARQFGQTGNYQKAIENLEQANKEAPNWAYPLYDLAYTYLLQDDYDNALKYYKLTDEVAPKGFYTSKTALHTLEKENAGSLQKGLYKSYLSLEWIDNQTEKQEMIKLLVEKFPSFAPAWKDYSSLLEGQERLNAIEKGLEKNPDIETKGMLLINKALVINENGDYKKASEILTNVIFDTNSTFGNIEMAKFILNNISE